MIDLLSAENFLDPFPTYKKLREHSPVCQIANGNMWAVSRYDDAKAILKDYKRFSSTATLDIVAPRWLKERCRRTLPLSTYDPPQHTHQRQLVNRAFASRVINGLEPHIRAIATPLVEKVTKEKKIELLTHFSLPYFGQIISLITGTDQLQLTEEIYEWLSLVTAMGIDRPDDETIVRLEAAIEKQVNHFETVINSRKNKPCDDLVTELIDAEIDGKKLDFDNLTNVLDVLARAGYMPPTHMLTNIILKLSRSPDLLRLLQQSPERIPAFIEEMLRYNPSIHCLLRKTTEPVPLHGVIIPEGANVLIIVASANRDSAQFNSPDVFDINRDENPHLTFGFGSHICIGAELTRLELRIALEILLPKINAIECPEDDELVWINSFFFRGMERLQVQFR